jgi:hypothetical protein
MTRSSIVNKRRNIKIPIVKVLITSPSLGGSAWLANETGRITVKIKIVTTIKLIINEITRNDQKYFADARKNSSGENFPDDLFSLPNNPPIRNVLRRKPVRTAINIPAEKEDNMLVKVAPRSVNISIFIPLASFSVIMLFPRPDINTPFIGTASILTSKSDENHIIKIPFHDPSERKAADFIAIIIFIRVCDLVQSFGSPDSEIKTKQNLIKTE